MRIGIVLSARWWRFSLNLEELGLAIAALGHEVVLVCQGDDAGDCRIPLVVATPDEQSDEAFWKRCALDVAVCFINLREPEIASALRRAGVFVILRADSDGQLSPRVFPYAAFLRLVTPAVGPWDAIKRFRHWVNCFYRHYREADNRILETFQHSDAVAIESVSAFQNLLKFLAYYGHSYPRERMGVIPHPVSDLFLKSAPVENPPPCILCLGRWEDDQKDARLLRAVIPQVLSSLPASRIRIAGSGVANVFADLAGRYTQLELLGKVPLDTIPELMDVSRFILSSSRWEGQPISGLEALCRGRTVVAPPLPGFVDMAEGGKSGSIASSHTPGALAHAALMEHNLWETKQRSPSTIAGTWRSRVSHDQVARDLINLHCA